MAEPLLVVENVVKNYGGLCAVDGASLVVPQGQFIGLVGPNGCGKTTLLSTIFGLRPADGGAIYFGGRRIDRLSPHQIFGLGLVNAFQFPRLFPTMTVLDNVLLAARNNPGDRLDRSIFVRRSWHASEEKLAIRAMEILELVNLARLTFAPARELSGGQQKLLEIGRALMAEPRMMLLDEPAAGVNPVLGKQIFEALEKLKQGGMSFLVIEHRLELLMAYADRVYLMDRGKIVLDGPPEKVVHDPMFFEVYIGTTRSEA